MPILLLGGIVIGALIGAIAPGFGTKLKPLGDIFLNLMFTIVVPLVFASIASAVGAMVNMKRLGKILGSTVLTFLVTGALAGVCADLGQSVRPCRHLPQCLWRHHRLHDGYPTGGGQGLDGEEAGCRRTEIRLQTKEFLP